MSRPENWFRVVNGIEIEGVLIPVKTVVLRVGEKFAGGEFNWIEGYIPLENHLWVEVTFALDDDTHDKFLELRDKMLYISLHWSPEDVFPPTNDDDPYGVVVQGGVAVRQTPRGSFETHDLSDPQEIFKYLSEWGSLEVIDSQALRAERGDLKVVDDA